MKFHFLGTGTSQGIPVIGCNCEVCTSSHSKDKRLRTAGLVEWEDFTLAIDVGPDFRQQMLRHQIDKVDAIIMTHEHNDHIAGLDDIRPYNFKSRKNMVVYAEERVAKALQQRFAYVFDVHPYPGAPRVELKSIKPYVPLILKGHKILPLRVEHGTLPILGFQFENLTYLTDVKYLPTETIEQIKNCEVLIISALHHRTHHSHLNLKEALALIEIINPQQCYLLHLSHMMGKHEDLAQHLPDHIHVAYDGLILELK